MSSPFHQIFVHSELVPASVFPHYPEEPITDMHWHEELELIASLDSRIHVTRGTQRYVLKENDVTVINSMETHRGIPLAGYAKKAISINISPTFLESFCPNFSYVQFSLEKKPEIRRQIGSCMQRLFIIYDSDAQEPYFKLEVNYLIYKIVHLLFTHCQVEKATPQHPSTVKYQQRYRQIIAYINKHYNEPLTLNNLANQVHISKEHLSREFKAYVGEGFREHLTSIRLSKAQRDLLDTDMPLNDIALKHGFADLRSYNKAFQNYSGMSPAQYRRQQKYEQGKPE